MVKQYSANKPPSCSIIGPLCYGHLRWAGGSGERSLPRHAGRGNRNGHTIQSGLFGKCHNGYNSGVVTDAAIDQLGKFGHTQWWQLQIDSGLSFREEY